MAGKTLKDRRKQTRRLAISALLSAIGVVLLYLGAFLEVLDLSVAVLASLLCVLMQIEMGKGWPWLVYAVIAILSLLLLPQKSPALAFALFFGHYAIVKAYLERLASVLEWLLKLLLFNAGLTAFLLVLRFFLPSAEATALPMALLTYLLGNGVFLLYDLALTRLVTAYLRVFRSRLRIHGW